MKLNAKQNNLRNKKLFATFPSRAIAFLTDLFMIGVPIALLAIVLFGYDQMNTASGLDVLVHDEKAISNPPNPISSITQIMLFLVAHVWLGYRYGQTPGKKFAGIKIVSSKTLQNASVSQLIVRFIGYFLSAISIIGFFIGLFRNDGRCLHDLISGTIVIKVQKA